MTVRENLEQWEKIYLSPYATLSMNSKGRAREEEQCDIRPVFQRDRDRIIHSKSFRRLKDKTQVFLSPEGDHYRTRLTHTLEVSQNARTIAKALQLKSWWKQLHWDTIWGIRLLDTQESVHWMRSVPTVSSIMSRV